MIRLKFPRLFECFQCKISHNFCCNERATDIRNNLLERNFTSLSDLSERLVSPFHRILSSLHRKTQQNYNIYIYVHAFAWAKCRGGSSFLSKLAARSVDSSRNRFRDKTQTGGEGALPTFLQNAIPQARKWSALVV